MTDSSPGTAGRSRFVGNAAALGVSTALAAVFSLVQIRILSDAFVPAEFGRFAATRGLALLVSLLAANGLPALLVRYLPGHEARGERRGAARLVTACAVAAGLLAWGVLALARQAGPVLPRGMGAGAGGLEVGEGFVLLAFGVALKLVLYGGFNGLRRFGAQTVLETTALAAQVGWIFFERTDLTVERLLVILGVVSVGTVVVGAPWLIARIVRDVREGSGSPGPAPDRVGGAYPRYWLGATGLSLVAIAFSDVDRWVLSSVVAFDALSFFHVGSRIVRLVDRFMAVPVVAFQPEVTRLDARARREDADRATAVFVRFSVVVGTLAAAAVAAYAPLIVRVAAGSRYGAASALVVALAAGIPLAAVTAPLTAVMKARDAVARALVCDLAWAIVYLASAIALVLSIGVVGAGIAHALARCVQLAVAVSLSGRRVMLRPVLSYAARLAAAATVAWFPPVIVWMAARGGAPNALGVLWLPVGIFTFRALVRRFGLLDAGDRGVLASLLSTRGMARLAAWI